mmetsp:Transcript_64847/g.111417  ORF Transcript_64847/g.111417 Transcript_64847/m.111417 type:complete len:240 (-) Transcript_64847:140-859(-)
MLYTFSLLLSNPLAGPCHGLSRAQRYKYGGAERERGGDGHGAPRQPHPPPWPRNPRRGSSPSPSPTRRCFCGGRGSAAPSAAAAAVAVAVAAAAVVAAQPVEVCAVVARKGRELGQSTRAFKRFGVKCYGGVRTEHPGAPTRRLFGADGVRGTVRSKEKLGVARCHRRQKRLSVLLCLKDGEAVEVRLDAPHQKAVAVVEQVLTWRPTWRRDRWFESGIGERRKKEGWERVRLTKFEVL